MNPQLQAILAGLGGQAQQGMATRPPPAFMGTGVATPGLFGGGQGGVPPGHEITIKGPPPPKGQEMPQSQGPKKMAQPAVQPMAMSPAPTPQQQNPMPPVPSPPIQPQNAGGASIPAAPIDPLSLIRRLFGGPAAAGTPGLPGASPLALPSAPNG